MEVTDEEVRLQLEAMRRELEEQQRREAEEDGSTDR